jgi:hypothetical protein
MSKNSANSEKQLDRHILLYGILEIMRTLISVNTFEFLLVLVFFFFFSPNALQNKLLPVQLAPGCRHSQSLE